MSKNVTVFVSIVLLLCLILFVRRMVDDRPAGPTSDWDIPWTLECEKCGKQHEQSKLEFASRTRDREDFKPSMRNHGHCPHCNTEWSARLMKLDESEELVPLEDETMSMHELAP